VGPFKLTVERDLGGIETLRGRIAGKQYLGYNDNALVPAFKDLLQELFPSPSRFETTGSQQNITLACHAGSLVPAGARQRAAADAIIEALLEARRTDALQLAALRAAVHRKGR